MTDRLPEQDWLQVVRHAPLVSIDLLVHNLEGAVLLGWRTNRPAQHCWFVPGGVIRKGETLQQAFARVVRDELGVGLPDGFCRAACYSGLYEHHYPDNFAQAPGFGTHYVVQAHRMSLRDLMPECASSAEFIQTLPKAQHTHYVWMGIPELLARADVHDNVKAYFQAA